ncbi:MAG TPA: Imm1 family immunity protein [Gemmataceae bacterium]|nr:Imm1 family immunity protein [Gemmataceae bacterium]
MFAKYYLLYDELDMSDFGKPWLHWKPIRHMKDVWNAFEKLDGDRFSILIVAEAPGPPESDVAYAGKALAVAGGKDNQYFCEAHVKEDPYASTIVRNPDVPVSYDDWVPLKRGELETFPRHQIVGREAVQEALKAFVKRGELSDKLIWKDEPEED